MDEEFEVAFNRALESVLHSHPLFVALGEKEMQETVAAFRQALDALVFPNDDAMSSWAKSWMRYQQNISEAWIGSSSSNASSKEGMKRDRRFSNTAWSEGGFGFMQDAYVLTAKTMTEMAAATGLPAHDQRKLDFYTRLLADAISPSNFLATNPEVLRRAQETNGQSLVEGFQNLLADFEKGYITTTDENAFKVGGNLATTPGSVVYKNELMELIQYDPVTPKVNAKPVLIVPPCINKFYIFDINEKKSMIRFMLEQGISVFVISWRNPSPKSQDFGWDEYVEKGIFAALSACKKISRAKQVDLLSWCNGGTMLIVALAVMDAEQRKWIGTATFLSTMIDFSDPGELEVFIDRSQVEAYSHRLRAAKIAPGRDIARAMAMLHVNESIWNFVVSNYLLGKSPPPFDILFWNSDTANLTANWYTYYIEKMYLENLLKDPSALEILEKPVDAGKIDVPCFFVAATGDHIVPWETSYIAKDLVGVEAEFVLTDGGHVSGTVINHPSGSRRSYFRGGDRSVDAESWKETATPIQGSWWPYWIEWLAKHDDGEVRAAPKSAGNKQYPVLDAAPGAYVVEAVAQDA